MRRTPALVVLAAAGLTIGIGTGHALTGPDRQSQLVSTSTPFADDPSPTTTPPTTAVAPSTTTPPTPTTSAPSTTVPAEGHHDGDHMSPPSTAPHEATEPHEHATPTTTVPPVRRTEPAELTIGCSTETGDPAVTCHWDGVPAGTTRIVVMRESPGTGPSQPLWSTTDTDERDHVDTTATSGTTYVYRASAYAGERFLGTSNPERIKAGGGEPAALATNMDLRCVASGTTTVRCTWSDGPTGTVGYRLVRTVDDRRGRVIAQPGGEARSADDRDAPLGEQTYYVHALDASGKVIGIGKAAVDCCTAGDR